jgi:hypothetical protein
MGDLRWVELAGRGGAFAKNIIVDEAFRRRWGAFSETFPRGSRRASSRCNHHKPKPSMIADARAPRPGAAKGVVPKKGIGIAFCMDGVPVSADMVKVDVPSTIAAGIRRRGIPEAWNTRCAPSVREQRTRRRD